jgi:hypothetical protein
MKNLEMVEMGSNREGKSLKHQAITILTIDESLRNKG